MSGLDETNERSNVHFLHIGKTGGSAIKQALETCLQTSRFRILLHHHGVSLQDVPEGELVVFCLRNPISRFVSGFYSRQRKGQPRYFSEWSAAEREVFERFETPDQIARALAEESSENHEAARRAMVSVEHFAPFRTWLVDLDYFRSRIDDVLFIGFQESLDADFAELVRILGAPPATALPTDDVGAHRTPPHLDRSIAAAGAAALERWYAEDFVFLELCKRIRAAREATRRRSKT